MSESTGKKRRRGQVLDDAILTSAWSLLQDRGWQGFSIEAVAEAAGTSKTVLYRRWRNRVELAQHLLTQSAISEDPGTRDVPLRQQLIDFLVDMSEFLASPFGEAVHGVLASPEFRSPMSALDGDTPTRVRRIVEMAIDRGELRGEPSKASINAGTSLLLSEFLHAGRDSLGREVANAIVDEVWLPSLLASSK